MNKRLISVMCSGAILALGAHSVQAQDWKGQETRVLADQRRDENNQRAVPSERATTLSADVKSNAIYEGRRQIAELKKKLPLAETDQDRAEIEKQIHRLESAIIDVQQG